MSATQPDSFGESHWIQLPYWAKSTNPIVRRHLGLYWRTVPPQIIPAFYIIIGWVVILVIGGFFPPLLNLIMPLTVASILVMPVTFLLFGHILLTVTIHTAGAMQEELRNHTLLLLRATPMSLEQIFLGKVAASLWRRMDDVVLVIFLIAIFAAPIMIMNYAPLFPAEQHPFLVNALAGIGLAISMLRILLEVIMVGVVAVIVGSVVPYRSSAIAASLTLNASYFLIINTLRYLPGIQENLFMIILVDFVIPIVASVVIILLGLRLAAHIVTSD